MDANTHDIGYYVEQDARRPAIVQTVEKRSLAEMIGNLLGPKNVYADASTDPGFGKYARFGGEIPDPKELTDLGYVCVKTITEPLKSRPDVIQTIKTYQKGNHAVAIYEFPNSKKFGVAEANLGTNERLFGYKNKPDGKIDQIKNTVPHNRDLDLEKYLQ
jgi:hypothetical protein